MSKEDPLVRLLKKGFVWDWETGQWTKYNPATDCMEKATCDATIAGVTQRMQEEQNLRFPTGDKL